MKEFIVPIIDENEIPLIPPVDSDFMITAKEAQEKDYQDMRRFQGDVIRLTHEINDKDAEIAELKQQLGDIIAKFKIFVDETLVAMQVSSETINEQNQLIEKLNKNELVDRFNIMMEANKIGQDKVRQEMSDRLTQANAQVEMLVGVLEKMRDVPRDTVEHLVNYKIILKDIDKALSRLPEDLLKRAEARERVIQLAIEYKTLVLKVKKEDLLTEESFKKAFLAGESLFNLLDNLEKA